MTTAAEHLSHVYAHRDEAARAWKAGGGKVVGYVEDNVPEELIIAAGFMPYRLSGDPHQPADTLKKYLYPFWKKHSLSDRQVFLGFQMSMLDLLFRGRFDFLDHLVIPYSRKGVLAYWQQLHDAKRAYPDLAVPDSWFLDRAITPGFDSSMFNQARIFDFRAQLERWSGAPVMDDKLASAIALTNAIRTALGRLATIRREGRVSGQAALALIGAGKLMPPADYLPLIEQAVDDLAQAPVRPGPRLFLSGSPQDNDQLYRIAEDGGATIVGENHYWGNVAGEYAVDSTLKPLIAVADMYHKKPASVAFPIQRTIDDCVRRAAEAGADGMIVSIYDHDTLEIWPVPDQIAALRARGVPTLYLHDQPYRIEDAAAIAGPLSAFLAGLGGTR